MDNSQTGSTLKDDSLWKTAQERAKFKRHLFAYILVSIFFWGVWAINGFNHGFHPLWPVFPMFFWGIGLFFNWYRAYYSHNDSMAEREYQKLINKQ